MRFRCVESRRGEDFEASKPKDYRNSPLLVQAPEVRAFQFGVPDSPSCVTAVGR